jgi:DNA polymerase
MKREDVYITNIVKCRPPGNRDPELVEVQVCTSHYLERQIQAINPRVIVTLGRLSMGLFLPEAKISAVHGQSMWVKGRLVVPMYHPAAALHQQSLRPTIEKDFARLPELIAKADDAPQNTEQAPDDKPKEIPKQLNLF